MPSSRAGLNRITVSLDSLDDATFRSMNDVDFPVDKVLGAIDAAANAGLTPVKVDMVVKRGHTDQDIESMAAHFKGSGHILRFIEFMDVGATNGWRMEDVVTAKEIRDRINAMSPIEPVEANYFGEVAERYRYVDGSGEIGIIASVTVAVLRRLHARQALGRRRAVYLPVRCARLQPARPPALRQDGRGDGRPPAHHLEPPRRPLQRATQRGHDRPREGRDVAHRRLSCKGFAAECPCR